jgi:hypothetical protein
MFFSSIKGLNTQISGITVGPDSLRNCRNVVFSKENFAESRHGHQYSAFKNPGTNAVAANDFSSDAQVVSFFYDDVAAQFYYSARYTDQPDASNARVNYKPTLFRWKNTIYKQTNTGIVPNNSSDVQAVEFEKFEIYKIAALPYKNVANDQTNPPILLSGYTCGLAATIVRIVDDVEIESAPVFTTIKNEKSEAFSIIAGVFIKGVNDTALATTNLFLRLYRTKQVLIRDATTFAANILPSEYFQAAADAPLSTQFKIADTSITSGSDGGSGSGPNRANFTPPLSGVPGDSARVVKILRGENPSITTSNLTLQKRVLEYNLIPPRTVIVDGSYVIVERAATQRILTQYGDPLYGIADNSVSTIDALVGQTIIPTANDDGLQSALYTNPNIDGVVGSNVAVQGSRGITEHKNNYFIYNLNSSDNLPITALSSAIANSEVTLFSGGIISQAYYADALNYLNTSVNVDSDITALPNVDYPDIFTHRIDTYTGLTPVISSDNPSIFIKDIDALCSARTLNNANNTFQVTLTPSDKNNLAKFVSPGIMAVVLGDGSIFAQTAAIIQYKSVTISGLTVTFNDIAIAGNENFAAPYTTITVGPQFGLKYIQGETYKNLSVYLLPVFNPNIGPYYFSLSSTGTNGIPYGIVSSYVTPAGTTLTETKIRVFLYGVNALSPSTILDNQTVKLVDDLNHSDHFKTFSTRAWRFIAKKTDNTGEFYIRSSNTGGTFSLASSVTGTFSNEGTVALKQKRKNQFYISRQNQPFLTTEAQYLAATQVGNENEEIQRIISNTDSVFILKDFTTWRTTLAFNTSSGVPVLDTLTVFDPTTGCVEGRSAQEIDEEIIWLDYSGFVSIRGQSINSIGKEIENEVKSAINICKAQGFTREISSFGNGVKHLYGCFIPTARTGFYPNFVYTGVTYVFDTLIRQWSKWDLPFVDANVDPEGRLSTLQTSIPSAQTPYTIHHRDVYTGGNPYNSADQYDMLIDVTGATKSIETNGNWRFESIPGSGTARADYITTSRKTDRVYLHDLTNNPPLFYGCTFVQANSGGNVVTVTPDAGLSEPDFITPRTMHLVFPVDAELEFQPFVGQNPSTLKQFTEWHVHTENAVNAPRMRFITDSRSTYTNWRNFKDYAPNRTVYRTFISTEANRGRWIIRAVGHARPYEYFRMTGQEVVSRETASTRSQKDQ